MKFSGVLMSGKGAVKSATTNPDSVNTLKEESSLVKSRL
jgi:hypothetical protein